MQNITYETRRESYRRMKSRISPRQQKILSIMGTGEMTAREIADALGYRDLNAVKPRLTELRKDGRVAVSGKRYDPDTDRNVTVFKAVW